MLYGSYTGSLLASYPLDDSGIVLGWFLCIARNTRLTIRALAKDSHLNPVCPAFLADGYVFPLIAGPNPTVDIVLSALRGQRERNALGDQASDIIQHAMQLSSSKRSAVVASNDNGVFHDLFAHLYCLANAAGVLLK